MTGVPPSGSGHSPKGEAAISVASPAKPSVPNAEMAARCLWCDSYEASVDADGLCDMCREPAPPPEKTFDTTVILERLNDIDVRFLEPLIKKAADNFYCQVLDTVDGYLLENLDFNMSSHVKMLERENQRMRTELWQVDRKLGGNMLGPESRIKSIGELHDASCGYHQLVWEVSKKHEGETRHETALRYIREREAASAIEGFAQDAEERLDPKGESAAPSGETPNA